MSKKVLFVGNSFSFFAHILQLTLQTTLCAVFGRFQCGTIKKRIEE